MRAEYVFWLLVISILVVLVLAAVCCIPFLFASPKEREGAVKFLEDTPFFLDQSDFC